MKPLGVGIIGAGHRSAFVFDQLRHLNVSLNGVADCSPPALERFRQHYTPATFTTADYHELLARRDIDAVFVMTRDYQHVEPALAALEAGKAVYLEKPMAITIEGCDRLLEASYRTGAKIFLGHNMRYMPAILKMKELVDSGLIGEVQAVWCRHFIAYGSCYFRQWVSERRNCHGLLLQKGAHDIDVIHWLAGAYTQRVVGMGKLSVYDRCPRRGPDEAPDREAPWLDSTWPPLEQTGMSPTIDVEDHNMIMLQLSNGVQASYTQCFYTPDAERNYTVIGTRGRIENMGDLGDSEIHAWTRRESRQQPDIVYKLKHDAAGHGGADISIIRAFVDFVQCGKVPNTSPLAARNAVAVGYLGHESMRSGCVPMTVPAVPANWVSYFEGGQRRQAE